ncbi:MULTISPECIES: hypothetical protein [unclassified Sulfuricurvum]|uniref:hypothetical protein n=1 Tax=unclassified Sulfuricurvum TaxID=2632390 RepID=UPI0002996AE2|nr:MULTISPECIES: hypothetical protein [unclassified Sulfuricurvum]AFV97072.1 hypothetical protein B649_03790 [Candidatus Sulfuricurvum sp. RIFRC-1]HBM35342.1 hypothetical protein [Sulfuricurvum sp.]
MNSVALQSINDGAKKLLKETIAELSKFDGLEYIIIGGWCPFLRNTQEIPHPGTLDVDILFREGYQSKTLEKVIKAFMEAGFIPSAKHPFQLLKKQQIQDKEFIFNIDLLHPKMTEASEIKGMFVDHLDLDIPLNREEDTVKMMSIVLPNSALLFNNDLFDKYSLDGLEFNLVDFTGMFLTKMESCQKQKRERDSFDIYLAFLNNGADIKKIKSIAKKNIHVKKALKGFKKFLRDKSDIFDSNINHFYKEYSKSPAKELLKKIK